MKPPTRLFPWPSVGLEKTHQSQELAALRSGASAASASQQLQEQAGFFVPAESVESILGYSMIPN